MSSVGLSHGQLVELAGMWLRKRCAVVITDMTHAGGETPDAIGWNGTHSTLVECKASRADFLADAGKSFRRQPETGMGSHRYFMAASGTIKATELPAAWGLLEVTGGKVRQVVKAEPQTLCGRQEVSLLLSALRRLGPLNPPGMSVRFYTMDSKQRASIAVEIEDEPTPRPPSQERRSHE